MRSNFSALVFLGFLFFQTNASNWDIELPKNSSALPVVSGKPGVSNGTNGTNWNFLLSAKPTLFSPHSLPSITPTQSLVISTEPSGFSNLSSIQRATSTHPLINQTAVATSVIDSVSGNPSSTTGANVTYAYSHHNITASHPQVSAKPVALTVSNGTYAYALKNASTSNPTNESYVNPAGRIAAAADDREPKAVFAHFMVRKHTHHNLISNTEILHPF